jgi:hypothetical protein
MHKTVLVLLALLCATGFAQWYEELWESDEVGNPNSIYVVGVANTDEDPNDELIFIAEEPWRDGVLWFWSLDLLTGEVEDLTDEFYTVYTDGTKAPRLVDIDGNGRMELLFLAQRDPGEMPVWLLYGWVSGTAAGDGGFRRLRGPRLDQNRPNPVGRKTTIGFELTKAGPAKVSIFDRSGRLVKELNAGTLDAGRHSVDWNRDDAQGRPVPQGAYFYQLESGGQMTGRKAVVAE